MVVDWVPIKIISFLSPFNFRKLEVNQNLISDKQAVREEGWSAESDLLER